MKLLNSCETPLVDIGEVLYQLPETLSSNMPVVPKVRLNALKSPGQRKPLRQQSILLKLQLKDIPVYDGRYDAADARGVTGNCPDCSRILRHSDTGSWTAQYPQRLGPSFLIQPLAVPLRGALGPQPAGDEPAPQLPLSIITRNRMPV